MRNHASLTSRARLLCSLLIAGCAAEGSSEGSIAEPDDEPTEVRAPEPDVRYLTPVQHLTRASMALRGQRPSLDELAAVREDPRWVEAIVDYYLTTPELGVTMRELHEQSLLSGIDPVIYPAGFPAIGALATRTLQEINESIVEAPLRLIEHVIMTDRPYSEIVTADYALANDVVATVWGMAYDPEGSRWQRTSYEDGRPMAGILSDSFLFTRHSTTYSNKSRGRANVISRALLCYDFLEREIPIDSSIDLADPDAVADAVRSNPACVSCHQTLDPLASYFSSYYPIYVPQDLEQYPFRFYSRAFADVFRAADHAGYFGIAEGDVRELGQRIAEDPRFSLCAAERFFGFLARVDREQIPEDVLAELQGVLLDHGMNARALAKAVVMSDAFRASHADSDEAAGDLSGLKKASPEQLARAVEALTGFRWRTELPIPIGDGAGLVGEVDLMDDAFFGFKVLAGGIDSNSVTRPSRTMSATVTLAVEALAARAAQAVVAGDFAKAPAERRLLTRVEPQDDDAALVREQVEELFTRFYGEADESVEEAVRLFFAVREASGDGARAWQLTLYAMLQDARFVYY
jgi:hypothetical protein